MIDTTIKLAKLLQEIKEVLKTETDAYAACYIIEMMLADYEAVNEIKF